MYKNEILNKVKINKEKASILDFKYALLDGLITEKEYDFYFNQVNY